MTYYSRADWHARPANGGPGPLNPADVEGIALHWPAMSSPIDNVAGVMSALRGWQNNHMDGQGWSDIGYQVAVDQSGNRYELRGLTTQSGANGSEDVNERFGAVLLILAPGEPLSEALVSEVRNVIADHRARFPHSDRIVGHIDIRPEPTACPGPIALAAIRAGRFEPMEDTMNAAQEKKLDEAIARLEALDGKVDRSLEKSKRVVTRLARAVQLLRVAARSDRNAADALAEISEAMRELAG